mgnify:CR=1 FL=1
MTKKGEITVFFSLILLCICSLMCGLLESARTAGVRWYVKMAADSAIDSVFSEYHREAWDTYRLFLLELGEEEELLKKWEHYMEPYMEEHGWYPVELKGGQIEEYLSITDDGGKYLRQEIADYMRFGILDGETDESGAESLLKGLAEAESVKTIASLYGEHTKEAVKLEKSIEAISNSLKSQDGIKSQGINALNSHDGSRFHREAAKLIKEIDRIPKLVKNYENTAKGLQTHLEETRQRLNTESENMTTSVRAALEEEIRCYGEYIDEEGLRRKEIEELWSKEEAVKKIIQEAERRAEEVEEIIDSWDEEEEEEGPDEDALWGSVARILESAEIPQLGTGSGIAQPDKEGILEQVQGLAGAGILSLVLPEGAAISQGVLNSQDFPSNGQQGADQHLINGESLIDRILTDEYCGRFFTAFTTEKDKEVKYELEYLIAGKLSDEENLKQVLGRLLGIREGLNLTHILLDSEKREEARALAAVITGSTGLLPLTGIITFFIMSVWALGEAMTDIKMLLEGQSVPVMKTRQTWNLSLEQLLVIGEQGKLSSTKSQTEGLDYVAYLKLMLLALPSESLYYRIMDIVQMNLRKDQDNFRMASCGYGAKISESIAAKHIFWSGGKPAYELRVYTEKAY